jgi:tRNA nucleotidyltransferase (CCA-adding enzyme)
LADLPEARVKTMNQYLKVPNAFSLLATRVSAARPTLKNALRDATECMALIRLLDALRRDEPFEGVCETLIALEQNSDEAKTTIELLRTACDRARTVTAADFTDSGLAGPELGAAIEAARIEQLRDVLP